MPHQPTNQPTNELVYVTLEHFLKIISKTLLRKNIYYTQTTRYCIVPYNRTLWVPPHNYQKDWSWPQLTCERTTPIITMIRLSVQLCFWLSVEKQLCNPFILCRVQSYYTLIHWQKSRYERKWYLSFLWVQCA